MSHLFLTGFMGAGKSTVGRLVAHRLGLPFVDLDELVVEREGREVRAIFAESGEETFRCAETGALDSLEHVPDSVVACGGGIVLRDENRQQLRRLGRIAYLVVSAEEALARVGDAEGRPLLAGEAGRMAETLLDARRTLYESVADITVETSGRSPGQVADAVVAALSGPPHEPAVVAVAIPDAPYEAVVGPGVLGSLGERVRRVLPEARRIALVTDEHVEAVLGARGRAALGSLELDIVPVVLPPGEESKSWERAGQVLEAFTIAGLARTDAVVALGGGVVGDLAGFCAAVYLRGVAVVQVPTTLLAQVDSSIGGKTGVDLPAGKNLAGAFWQPTLVLTDTSVLDTLPDREWRSGLAEVAKTAILSGGGTLTWLEENAEAFSRREEADVARAVEACVRFKATVVAGDEREAGRRECLNLGHTLGHAIEKVAGFGVVPHGLAVADGIRFAARLAERMGLSDGGWRGRQEALLDALGLSTLLERYDPASLRETMAADKKSRGGRVRFALATGPGECDVLEVDDALLGEAVDAWVRGERG